jgi:hypothetical protein
MKLEKKPDKELKLTTFSKVSDLKIPDSPPPEKAKEDDNEPGGMTKFE